MTSSPQAVGAPGAEPSSATVCVGTRDMSHWTPAKAHIVASEMGAANSGGPGDPPQAQRAAYCPQALWLARRVLADLYGLARLLCQIMSDSPAHGPGRWHSCRAAGPGWGGAA